MNNKALIKNIWILHHYATPPNSSGQIRPYNFGIQLKSLGFNATVFSASYLHHSHINLINDNRLYTVNNDSEIPFVFINTPSSTNNGPKRILNMIAFYKNLFRTVKNFIKDREKPNLIIASSPHPLTMIAGIKIAKMFKIPCICEVRDFWPEVFFMSGKLKEESIIGKLLLKGENWIYKHADAIIFLKEGDATYISDKKWDLGQGGNIDLKKCYYINNGVDIEKFNRQLEKEVLYDEDLSSDKFNVVYTGSIRPVNNVDNILDAALLLKENCDIQFLIYGDGNELESLKKRVIDEGINNVKLKGYVEKKYIPYVLSRSSVNILNYSQSKYNWSRGNSSNKLFEYMASGKPIISTVKMGYCPLKKYTCGISLEQCTPESLANAIISIYRMPKESYIEMSENAKRGANDFDYKLLTQKLVRVMENLLS